VFPRRRKKARKNVDLAGPFSIKTPKGVHKILLLPAIDPATGWFQMKELQDLQAYAFAPCLPDLQELPFPTNFAQASTSTRAYTPVPQSFQWQLHCLLATVVV